ncbi:MAG: hypothetical protein F4047_00715 [Caldilineaceae bacterium SB0670_bin_27]|uniref:Uncharacterized protein n=1 Tax=Caldilineaceae bacterium SB0664_bin_27 TaxID=2605260 RepID=A0A6B0YY11_9CHLR|nr:hypothetical protein [Caldilineaceae bacterium SB0664_bin_27]MYJ76704.1 hypothetical protein [Caldilineaceae bacterium SB0670_bin_27]
MGNRPGRGTDPCEEERRRQAPARRLPPLQCRQRSEPGGSAARPARLPRLRAGAPKSAPRQGSPSSRRPRRSGAGRVERR